MKDGIRLICAGTATPASDLVPKAVAMVDRLREVDGEFGYQQWRVSDTQFIEVKINGTHATIWIWESDKEGGKRCPEYLSGMTWDGVLVKRTDPDTGKEVLGTRYFQPSLAYAARKGLPAGWQVGNGMRASTNPFEIAPGFVPLDGPGYWTQQGWAQIATLHACAYSGTMRQVVQVLLGMSVTVPYRYDFYCTHGVWTSTSKGKRDDWLVEISQSRGVIAQRLPKCRASVPAESVLGYVPTGETFPTGVALAAAIEAGTVRQLIAADNPVLKAYFERSPIYHDCGWAFSRSGRLVSNVSSVPTTIVLNGVTCSVASTNVHTIRITGGEDGPTAATIESGSDGTAVAGGGNEGLKCQLRVPIDGTPMTWAPSLPSESLADYLSANAIVHVWYEGEELKTVSMATDPANTARPDDELPRPRNPGNTPYPTEPEYGLNVGTYWLMSDASYYQEFVEYPASLNSSSRRNRSMSSPARGFALDNLSNARRTYFAERTGFTFHQSGLSSFPFSNQVHPEAAVRVHSTVSNGQSVIYYDDVVVPPYEREGVIHYRYKHTQDAGPKTSEMVTGILIYATWDYKASTLTDWGSTPLTIIYDLDHEYLPEDGRYFVTFLSSPSTNPFPSEYLKGDFGSYGGGGLPGEPPNPWVYVTGDTTYSDPGGISTLSGLFPYYASDTNPAPAPRATADAVFSGSGGISFSLSLSFADADPSTTTNNWTRKNPSATGDITSLKVIRSADGARYFASPNLNTGGYSCSNFGGYESPPSDIPVWSINFVGDP